MAGDCSGVAGASSWFDKASLCSKIVDVEDDDEEEEGEGGDDGNDS